MKKLFLLAVLSLTVSASLSSAQTYKTMTIQKKVADFQPLGVDVSSALNAYLSKEHMWISGRQSLYNQIHSYSHNRHMETYPDRERSPEYIDRRLNIAVEEVIHYGDSVAAVIVWDKSEEEYIIHYLAIEDGQWVNTGENTRRTLEGAREETQRLLQWTKDNTARVERVKKVPSDTKPFVDYLRNNGADPKDYVLGKLASYPIVVFGEKHRRKASWDLMKNVIADPRFPEITGIIFMELPSHMQPVMDEFMSGTQLNGELAMDVMWELQPHGWWDRGEYEFLCDLWKINNALPVGKKVKVVLVDFQIPYSKIQTEEEIEEAFVMDRNLHMADRIEDTLKESSDSRNALFIVGYGHAYKSPIPGGGSTPRGHKQELTVVAQLVERFSDEDVFSIKQHFILSDNSGANGGLVRHGVFDKAFEEAGFQSVGFDLRNSPFGREPYDGDIGMMFNPDAGNFEDNYDGYILLELLRTEGNEYILFDIFTEKYINELRRRADIFRYGKNYWFGLEPHQITPERVAQAFRDVTADDRPWESVFQKYD